MSVENNLYRYLDTVGDGTGTKIATGNYSVMADDFKISPGATERFEIHRMVVFIEEDARMSLEEYGGMGVALTNGIPVKTNGGWSRIGGDITIYT